MILENDVIPGTELLPPALAEDFNTEEKQRETLKIQQKNHKNEDKAQL